MTPTQRVDAYRTAGFPQCVSVGEDGRIFGIWTMGNDYRVKSGYHGGYPNTYLRRVRAMFPDKSRTLHVFSGKVDLSAFPGDTVDLNTDLGPTFLCDAQDLTGVPLEDYDLVLADPPYSGEDADRYGTTMVKRNKVMQALGRLPTGAHVVWLDQMLPMYRKDVWALEGSIGIRRSTNHRYRCVDIFRRR